MHVGDVLQEPDSKSLHIVFAVQGSGCATLRIAQGDLARWEQTPLGLMEDMTIALEAHSEPELRKWAEASPRVRSQARKLAFGETHLIVLPVLEEAA